MNKFKNNGFTLVELAISLVIVAIITGLILGGSDLTGSSKRSSIIASFSQFNSAYKEFYSQTSAIPGDMIDAAAFFGEGNFGSAPTNGDGNGFIGSSNYQTSSIENVLSWLHLSRLKLLESTYSGALSGDSSSILLGRDVPRGADEYTGYGMRAVRTVDYGGGTSPFSGNNAIVFGAVDGDLIEAGALTPEDAFNIDEKIDDAQPFLGDIVMLDGSDVGTAGDCVNSSGTINIQEDIKSCILVYYQPTEK